MMSDLIYSYVFKLSRAKEHLETLDKELRAFLQPGSYEILDEYNIEGEVEGITRGSLTRRVIFGGDPASCIKAIKMYEDIGVDQVMMIMQTETIPHEKVMSSIEMFGKHIFPAFRQAETAKAGATS